MALDDPADTVNTNTDAPHLSPTTMSSPEAKNYAEIERLERLLAALRQEGGTARETEAIREIGFEIALAVREVGAVLLNAGWPQSYASAQQDHD